MVCLRAFCRSSRGLKSLEPRRAGFSELTATVVRQNDEIGLKIPAAPKGRCEDKEDDTLERHSEAYRYLSHPRAWIDHIRILRRRTHLSMVGLQVASQLPQGLNCRTIGPQRETRYQKLLSDSITTWLHRVESRIEMP